MAFTDQLQKLKENWFLVLLVVLVVLFSSFSPLQEVASFGNSKSYYDNTYATGSLRAMEISPSSYSIGYSEGFAPELDERKITSTISLATKIERGDFAEATQDVKKFVAGNDGLIISQDENTYGEGRRAVKSAAYTIKVPLKEADGLIFSLRSIGEVQSFSDNRQDITEAYQDNEIELAAEKQRLLRYQKMLDEATTISEKIELSDRIFNQERTIKYLEGALKNKDQQVQYTTIYFTLQEKASAYIDVVWVRFSDLVRNLVESVNGLLSLITWILPWALVGGIIWYIIRKIKHSKR